MIFKNRWKLCTLFVPYKLKSKNIFWNNTCDKYNSSEIVPKNVRVLLIYLLPKALRSIPPILQKRDPLKDIEPYTTLLIRNGDKRNIIPKPMQQPSILKPSYLYSFFGIPKVLRNNLREIQEYESAQFQSSYTIRVYWIPKFYLEYSIHHKPEYTIMPR